MISNLIRKVIKLTMPRGVISVVSAAREARRSRVRKRLRGQKIIRTIDNITYELDLNEMIDGSLYFNGVYERKTARVLTDHVKVGMTIFDVGANIGSHTLPMSCLVGKEGRVYAFEPVDYAFRKLCRNLALNDLPNCHAEQLALSDEPGLHTIQRGPSDVAGMPFKGSWRLDGTDATFETDESIRFETLDNYVKTRGIERIDLLKIDVDGYEVRMIRGAMQTLKRDRPFLCIELSESNPERLGDNLSSLLQALRSVGYRLRDIETDREVSDEEIFKCVRAIQTNDFFGWV